MKNTQQTIEEEVKIKGIGLHTGKRVNLTFKPSLPNTGVTFKRTDV